MEEYLDGFRHSAITLRRLWLMQQKSWIREWLLWSPF